MRTTLAILLLAVGWAWGGSTKYVDLSQPTDTLLNLNSWFESIPIYQHMGTEADPFNWRNFFDYNFLNLDGGPSVHGRIYYNGSWHYVDSRYDTFMIKGSCNLPGRTFLQTDTQNFNYYYPWNPRVNGPWRVRCSATGYTYGNWYGGVYQVAWKYFKAGSRYYNMVLMAGSNDTWVDGTLAVSENVFIYESTIMCDELTTGPPIAGNGIEPRLVNCLLLNNECNAQGGTRPLTMINCASWLTRNYWAANDVTLHDTNCLHGFRFSSPPVPITSPTYNAPIDSFKALLMLDTCYFPPRPGRTPYATSVDLYGFPRTDIGGTWNPSIHTWIAKDSAVNVLWSNLKNWDNFNVPDSMDTIMFNGSGGSWRIPEISAPLSVGKIIIAKEYDRTFATLVYPLTFNNGGLRSFMNDDGGGQLGFPNEVNLNGPNDSIDADSTPILSSPAAYQLTINGANAYISVDSFIWTKVVIKAGSKLTCANIQGLGGTAGAPDSLVSGTAGVKATVTKPKDTVAYQYSKDIIYTNGSCFPVTSLSGGNNQNLKTLSYTGVTKDISTGPAGTVVTFTGSGFAGDCWVKFGSDSSALMVVSYTSATKAVPTLAAGVYAVSVGNSDGDKVNVGNFTVTAAATTGKKIKYNKNDFGFGFNQ